MAHEVIYILHRIDGDAGAFDNFKKYVDLFDQSARAAGLTNRYFYLDELTLSINATTRLVTPAGEDLLAVKRAYIVENCSHKAQHYWILEHLFRVLDIHRHAVLMNSQYRCQSYLEYDKVAIQAFCSEHGIARLNSVLVKPGRLPAVGIEMVRQRLGDGPYILKPAVGGGGRCVLICQDKVELAAALDLSDRYENAFLVQSFVPDASDYRVYLLRGEILAVQKRTPQSGNYLANISQGACGNDAVLDETIAQTSLRIASLLEAEYMCIDWLVNQDGYFMNEWCTILGGFSGLPENSRNRVGVSIYKWILEKIEH